MLASDNVLCIHSSYYWILAYAQQVGEINWYSAYSSTQTRYVLTNFHRIGILKSPFSFYQVHVAINPYFARIVTVTTYEIRESVVECISGIVIIIPRVYNMKIENSTPISTVETLSKVT